MAEKIVKVGEFQKGVELKITDTGIKELAAQGIKLEDGWKFIENARAYCFEQITCDGRQIQVMAKGALQALLCISDVTCSGSQITKMGIGQLFRDFSHVLEPICICPEGDCVGAVGMLELGFYLRDEDIYISMEKIAKKIPLAHRKAFLSLMNKITREI